MCETRHWPLADILTITTGRRMPGTSACTYGPLLDWAGPSQARTLIDAQWPGLRAHLPPAHPRDLHAWVRAMRNVHGDTLPLTRHHEGGGCEVAQFETLLGASSLAGKPHVPPGQLADIMGRITTEEETGRG